MILNPLYFSVLDVHDDLNLPLGGFVLKVNCRKINRGHENKCKIKKILNHKTKYAWQNLKYLKIKKINSGFD